MVDFTAAGENGIIYGDILFGRTHNHGNGLVAKLRTILVEPVWGFHRRALVVEREDDEFLLQRVFPASGLQKMFTR